MIVAILIFSLYSWYKGSDRVVKEQAAQQTQQAADKVDSEKLDAYIAAQHFVDQRLKSPGSAKYPIYNSGYVTITLPGTYIVKSYVDSQNGFGALLRSDWTVKMHTDSKDFVADNVSVNQE